MKILWCWQVRRLTITLEWKVEDLWIGAFWRRSPTQVGHVLDRNGTLHAVIDHDLDVWICFLPCFPIHISKQA